ncbi:MAG: protein-L-isoaspartate(D-aspartate) O-methyltransferase [Candidatus Solibacter usitatus]|nr:protein-L-isoaspartate(D-aspartate) O-methyltransferase [Candidatus Solibacter usitatus]
MQLWPSSPLAFSLCLTAGLEAQDWTGMRARMVTTQIERRGVKHPGVLAAMREIPRHLFVPEAVRSSAYEDRPLPIGHGQTISQPYIVGSMTELLDVKPGHKVLEIGTGSGYQAAVLCRLAARVFSIEIVEPLARESYARLQTLGCGNVRVRAGDGYLGWPEEAPFDRIILTAAPPEIPQELIRQLKNGGRLIAPVGRQWQDLVVIDKDAAGKVSERVQYPVVFVPMVPGRK